MSEQPNDKPVANAAPADADAGPVAGTETGNPVAGLELDRETAPEVVAGDTGPEGNRQTSLAPPIE